MDRGAGEILLTSMNHDGTKEGFSPISPGLLSKRLRSCYCWGELVFRHFRGVQEASAIGTCASIFHFREVGLRDLKTILRNGILVSCETNWAGRF